MTEVDSSLAAEVATRYDRIDAIDEEVEKWDREIAAEIYPLLEDMDTDYFAAFLAGHGVEVKQVNLGGMAVGAAYKLLETFTTTTAISTLHKNQLFVAGLTAPGSGLSNVNRLLIHDRLEGYADLHATLLESGLFETKSFYGPLAEYLTARGVEVKDVTDLDTKIQILQHAKALKAKGWSLVPLQAFVNGLMETQPKAVSILLDLGRRFEGLLEQPDLDVVASLEGWLQQKGLERLGPALNAVLKTVRESATDS
ncbi:Hypothetical protein POVN_LOCUS352 [uncultured virus]|nr:Hypothetical protein POVN_LOCUS352 [uncultured virus]